MSEPQSETAATLTVEGGTVGRAPTAEPVATAPPVSGMLYPFANEVRLRPEAIAVQDNDACLTYRELDDRSTRLAYRLIAEGVEPGQLVAIEATRAAGTIVDILAVHKASAAYLPLDPNLKDDLRAALLQRADPVLAPDWAHLHRAVDELPLGRHLTAGEMKQALPVASADALAYVMPTSGTMGSLKLVEVTHGALASSLAMLEQALAPIPGASLRPGDGYLHCAPFSFSSSVRQLFRALAAGARVVLAGEDDRRDPQAVIDLIYRHNVSILDLTPSMFQLVLDVLERTTDLTAEAARGSPLRVVLLASEALHQSTVDRWARMTSHVMPHGIPVIGMYGQTETTGIVCLRPARPGEPGPNVLLGTPLPGITLSVRWDDETAGTASADEVPDLPYPPGELYVSSPGLARGYRNDLCLTVSTFVNSGSAEGEVRVGPRACRTGDLVRQITGGEWEFAGRRDSMVTVAGRQVDLTEIENALRSHPTVAEAVAVLNGDGPGARLLVYAELLPGVADISLRSAERPLPNGLCVVDGYQAETDFMYQEIFVRRTYLQHGLFLPDHACVVDAGANIGLFSMLVALLSPGARVFAFEPALATSAVLRANLRINDITGVHVRSEALSDHAGPGELTFYPRSPGMSSLYAEHNDELATLQAIISNQIRLGEVPDEGLQGQTADLAAARLSAQRQPCRIVRLSDVIRSQHLECIDLLKIDVQKSEWDLLQGIDPEHWPLIQQIAMELHDIDGRVLAVRELLTGFGFSVVIEQDPRFAGSSVHMLFARRSAYQPAVGTPAASRARAVAEPVAAGPRMKITDGDLRRHIESLLANAGLPIRVLPLAVLPRTTSGKPDRSWLAARGAALTESSRAPEVTGHAAPAATSVTGKSSADVNRLIGEVQRLWSEVLGVDVQAGDDFFSLGGSSLSAARIIARVRERYAPAATIRLVFDHPTPPEFAQGLSDLTARKGAGAASGQGGLRDADDRRTDS